MGSFDILEPDTRKHLLNSLIKEIILQEDRLELVLFVGPSHDLDPFKPGEKKKGHRDGDPSPFPQAPFSQGSILRQEKLPGLDSNQRRGD
jgi:hypothetical protein